MAFTDDQLNKIRNESFTEKLVMILRIQDSDGNILARVTNSESDVVISGVTYTSFGFQIGIQGVKEGRPDEVLFKFHNGDQNNVNLYKLADKISRVSYSVVSVDDPDTDIYPEVIFVPKVMNQELGFTQMELENIGIYERKFPFEVFNSEQHPGLYS